MPKFMDSHPSNPNMPPEVLQGIRQKLQARRPDEFGVVGINMIWNADRTYCLAEAPNAEAVHKTHEKMGLKLGKGDVVEVQTAL